MAFKQDAPLWRCEPGEGMLKPGLRKYPSGCSLEKELEKGLNQVST